MVKPFVFATLAFCIFLSTRESLAFQGAISSSPSWIREELCRRTVRPYVPPILTTRLDATQGDDVVNDSPAEATATPPSKPQRAERAQRSLLQTRLALEWKERALVLDKQIGQSKQRSQELNQRSLLQARLLSESSKKQPQQQVETDSLEAPSFEEEDVVVVEEGEEEAETRGNDEPDNEEEEGPDKITQEVQAEQVPSPSDLQANEGAVEAEREAPTILASIPDASSSVKDAVGGVTQKAKDLLEQTSLEGWNFAPQAGVNYTTFTSAGVASALLSTVWSILSGSDSIIEKALLTGAAASYLTVTDNPVGSALRVFGSSAYDAYRLQTEEGAMKDVLDKLLSRTSGSTSSLDSGAESDGEGDEGAALSSALTTAIAMTVVGASPQVAVALGVLAGYAAVSLDGAPRDISRLIGSAGKSVFVFGKGLIDQSGDLPGRVDKPISKGKSLLASLQENAIFTKAQEQFQQFVSKGETTVEQSAPMPPVAEKALDLPAVPFSLSESIKEAKVAEPAPPAPVDDAPAFFFASAAMGGASTMEEKAPADRPVDKVTEVPVDGAQELIQAPDVPSAAAEKESMPTVADEVDVEDAKTAELVEDAAEAEEEETEDDAFWSRIESDDGTDSLQDAGSFEEDSSFVSEETFLRSTTGLYEASEAWARLACRREPPPQVSQLVKYELSEAQARLHGKGSRAEETGIAMYDSSEAQGELTSSEVPPQGSRLVKYELSEAQARRHGMHAIVEETSESEEVSETRDSRTALLEISEARARLDSRSEPAAGLLQSNLELDEEPGPADERPVDFSALARLRSRVELLEIEIELMNELGDTSLQPANDARTRLMDRISKLNADAAIAPALDRIEALRSKLETSREESVVQFYSRRNLDWLQQASSPKSPSQAEPAKGSEILEFDPSAALSRIDDIRQKLELLRQGVTDSMPDSDDAFSNVLDEFVVVESREPLLAKYELSEARTRMNGRKSRSSFESDDDTELPREPDMSALWRLESRIDLLNKEIEFMDEATGEAPSDPLDRLNTRLAGLNEEALVAPALQRIENWGAEIELNRDEKTSQFYIDRDVQWRENSRHTSSQPVKKAPDDVVHFDPVPALERIDALRMKLDTMRVNVEQKAGANVDIIEQDRRDPLEARLQIESEQRETSRKVKQEKAQRSLLESQLRMRQLPLEVEEEAPMPTPEESVEDASQKDAAEAEQARRLSKQQAAGELLESWAVMLEKDDPAASSTASQESQLVEKSQALDIIQDEKSKSSAKATKILKQLDAAEMVQNVRKTKEARDKKARESKYSESEISSEETSEASNKIKIYVSNLDWATDEEFLRQIFEEFGAVEDLFLPRDNRGRKRGFGFVTMSRQDGINAIANLDQVDVDGRIISVSEARDNRKDVTENGNDKEEEVVRLHVGNLSYNSRKQQITKLFETIGPVRECIMPRGRGRGFCFIDMPRSSGLLAIQKLDGYELDGWQLKVTEARPYETQPLNM